MAIVSMTELCCCCATCSPNDAGTARCCFCCSAAQSISNAASPPLLLPLLPLPPLLAAAAAADALLLLALPIAEASVLLGLLPPGTGLRNPLKALVAGAALPAFPETSAAAEDDCLAAAVLLAGCMDVCPAEMTPFACAAAMPASAVFCGCGAAVACSSDACGTAFRADVAAGAAAVLLLLMLLPPTPASASLICRIRSRSEVGSAWAAACSQASRASCNSTQEGVTDRGNRGPSALQRRAAAGRKRSQRCWLGAGCRYCRCKETHGCPVEAEQHLALVEEGLHAAGMVGKGSIKVLGGACNADNAGGWAQQSLWMALLDAAWRPLGTERIGS